MTIWKSVNGWTYEYYELDTSAMEFDEFEPIVDLWNSKKNNTNIPSWSDFDFYDFKGWHGKVSKSTRLFDTANLFDYKIDLFGTDLVNLFGCEMTGLTGRELVNIGGEDFAGLEFYEWVCENAYISRVRGNIPVEGREHKVADLLELPLSDDGKTVTHFIEILIPN